MEKIIYPVWKKDGQSIEGLKVDLLGAMSQQLLSSSGLRRLRVSISDRDVEPAVSLRQENTRPLMDAVIFLWVDSANDTARFQQVIENYVGRLHGYLVTESEAIVNTDHVADDGCRTYGMSEVVFLQKPPRLSYEEWLDIWLSSHTKIAIDTQSTFGYRQNVVVRKLTYAAPDYSAIIEENFPPEAMESQHAFYDAIGNDQKMRSNQKAMVDSVMRFIDFDKIDVLPTSEYTMKS